MNQTNLFRGGLLRLAAPRPEDREVLAAWTNDPEYLRNVDTDIARPKTPDEVFMPNTDSGNFAFHLRTLADDTLIGFVALFSIEWNNGNATTAVGIGEAKYRGKGYGADALFLILRYAFTELNLHRVGLDVISYNRAAIRAYERAGFRTEGVLRGAVLRDGSRSDRLMMGILHTEWKDLQKS